MDKQMFHFWLGADADAKRSMQFEGTHSGRPSITYDGITIGPKDPAFKRVWAMFMKRLNG